ncbi:hypothetical protein V474_01885 [Novosphingobium barchaimii LL02]|uniref:Uncharacterized protein n=2 Tax=Novosphingobium barchaimii TaxID=1420591 RepID=A0A0J7XJ99_9SPHN|nr:hypothetical protein V474_01885 [Novosphingobium barchaimii LL02]
MISATARMAGKGAFLSAFGAGLVQPATAQALAQQVKYLKSDGAKVTYKVAKDSWLAVSGTIGNQIFYQRATVDTIRFASFRLTYPKAQAAKWKPIVARMSSCLNGEP